MEKGCLSGTAHKGERRSIIGKDRKPRRKIELRGDHEGKKDVSWHYRHPHRKQEAILQEVLRKKYFSKISIPSAGRKTSMDMRRKPRTEKCLLVLMGESGAV